jgi:hypothetical protein
MVVCEPTLLDSVVRVTDSLEAASAGGGSTVKNTSTTMGELKGFRNWNMYELSCPTTCQCRKYAVISWGAPGVASTREIAGICTSSAAPPPAGVADKRQSAGKPRGSQAHGKLLGCVRAQLPHHPCRKHAAISRNPRVCKRMENRKQGAPKR